MGLTRTMNYRLQFYFNLLFIGDKKATINVKWVFFIFSLFLAKYGHFLMIFQIIFNVFNHFFLKKSKHQRKTVFWVNKGAYLIFIVINDKSKRDKNETYSQLQSIISSKYD